MCEETAKEMDFFFFRRTGVSFFTLFTPIKFYFYPFDAGRGFFFYPLYAFLNFIFSLRRAQAARGPLLSGQQKVGKDWPKRAAPPLGFPLAVALECLRHNRARGVTELLAACAAGASARFAKALPQKPFRTRYHAHSRMIGGLSSFGNLRGQGGQSP